MVISLVDGQHHVEIMERGGKRRVAELQDIDRVIWSRTRDDISTASVSLSAQSATSQAALLRELAGSIGRYEMCIWRGDARVWEGPITLGTFHREGLVLQARDVMHYASRTIMHAGYDNSYPNETFVVERARLILATELARKEALETPINVVPYIVAHTMPTDATTASVTLPYQFTVFEHVDALAARNGIDYTVLGRAIHIWDTSQPAMGYTPTMTEADFLGEVFVSVYGMELGTIAAVTDGQGNYGVAGAIDDYYGEVERLDTAYDEDATSPTPTSELRSQAQRNLSGRNPTPIQVRIPDNSGLSLNGAFTIDMLVPGVYVPLRATLNLVEISQMQKLQSCTVTETEAGETIQVKLFPSSSEDQGDAS